MLLKLVPWDLVGNEFSAILCLKTQLFSPSEPPKLLRDVP